MQIVDLYNAGIAREQRVATDRRRFSWRTVLYASRYRRRTGSRRQGDSMLLSSDILPFTSSLFILSLVLLSLMDAFFTTVLLGRGAVELNPFMAYLIQHDMMLFALVKVKVTGLCAVVMALFSKHTFWGIKGSSIALLMISVYLVLVAWELLLLN